MFHILREMVKINKKRVLGKGVQFAAGLFLLIGFFLLPTISGLYCPYVERSNGTYVEYTQFMNSSGDGALILDRDNDGTVDAEDLFGGRNLTGRDIDNAFEDLALLDSNGDGIINFSDSNYTQLKIWRVNGSGSGLEIIPLNNTVNMTRINLAYRDVGATDPYFWRVLGEYNSSDFNTNPIAVGVNFTTINGVLNEGDFFVLDLNNANNITIANTTQCSTPMTISLESPANASTESSDATPNFFFNITDNSATVNCTLWINSSGTVASYANNNSVLNVTSTTLTANASLSNGDYYWWINCSDDSGAPVTTYESVKRLLTLNIAASSSPSSSSSSGGGSGGSVSQSFWTNTFAEDDVEFSEKKTISKSLSIKHRIRIKINEEQHFIGIINLTNTSATINVSSTPQQAVLNIGEEKRFDVNNNGYHDLIVKLVSINSSKVELELKYVSEKAPERENNFEESQNKSEIIKETNPANEIKNKSWINKKIIMVVALLLIISIIIIYTYKSKKRKKK